MFVFILNLIIYRCMEGYAEAATDLAVCVVAPAEEKDGEDGEDGEDAEEDGNTTGERRLCVYLFLIYAYVLMFWAMKRKNEI